MIEITYVRASSLLIRFSCGLRVLTDPWFRCHLRGLPCFKRPGIALAELPPIDVVLASHLHPDHYDRRAVGVMARRSALRVIGPRGTARASLGIPATGVLEMSPWESAAVGDVVFTATPSLHSGLEINFLLQEGEKVLFFGGDCRFSESFREIASRGRVHVAMLPIGGTRVLGRQIVMGPGEALRAARILQAEVVIPIHEGGIWMSVPPLSLHPGRPEQLVRRVREQGLDTRVVVLRNGQTFRYA